ncbi:MULTISPECIES: RNA polymerase sigma-70 factor [Bacteroidaceae]|nr:MULTISPECIES: RNA polymerase sigma-70 factor [Bacteroidaceae]MBS5610094.1 RNA polymerase sigma-70 factor [Bacteroides sp.]MBS6549706.1 RNA polymerase sigma-70 factor [Bacteroides sp.]MBV3618073.1 RNA polymerase sigma-70 factor [Bacteroides xylanisolvens]MCE8748843.1 RNA polymerase sigma-70 factor [Bacteroides ovatus]MCE9418897.1 RNA polymerase sigma-70 factor [Bacteroides xylanisolvens]
MTFDNIYSEYYQRCFLFAKSYLHDEMLSKDIASEAMITLWTTMKTEEVDNIRAFLMTVVKNQSLNHLRNEHLRMEARENILNDELYELDFRISSLDACNPTDIFSEEINRIVNRTLDTLPLQTRNVFRMSRYENKSIKEIADTLNISVKGVDYHIGKALKALRVNLKDYLYLFFI